MVSPFFLMYLYSMTVLAGNVTVAVYPYPVSKTTSKKCTKRSSNSTHRSRLDSPLMREGSHYLGSSCRVLEQTQQGRRSL